MRKAAAVVVVLALSGCTGYWQSLGEESPYFAVPKGSSVSLTQPVQAPADSASVFIQNGRVVPRNGFDNYRPYCVLELSNVRSSPQTIAPDTFAIESYQRERNFAALPSPLRYVSQGDSDNDNDQGRIRWSTVFRLHSARQPQVYALTCEYWDPYGTGNNLTLAEIRRTGAPLLEFHIASQR